MKLITGTLILTTAFAFNACKCTSKHGASEGSSATLPDSLSEYQRDGYAMGSLMATDLLKNGFDSIDVVAFNKGFEDKFKGDSLLVSEEESNERIREIAQAAQERKQLAQLEKGKGAQAEGTAFLEINKNKPGVETLASGLQYKILSKGIGAFPKAIDQVKVHYEGKLLNGEIFDSSFKRGEPITFGLNQVIPGWTEGMQYINEGGEIELYIPWNLAYGDRGAGGSIPPYATLIFKVKLIEIIKGQPQEHGPNDGHNH